MAKSKSNNRTDQGITKATSKYWKYRHQIFSRFDQGIRLNEEQWYSVTPESVARVIASQVKSLFPDAEVILDGFCGAGGNTIQFAYMFPRVIASEINPETYADAINNLSVYDVQNAQIMLKDFFELDLSVKPDVIFLSPPWGGPKYKNKTIWELDQASPYTMYGKSFITIVDQEIANSSSKIVEHALTICENLVLFLPRTSDLNGVSKKSFRMSLLEIHSRQF